MKRIVALIASAGVLAGCKDTGNGGEPAGRATSFMSVASGKSVAGGNVEPVCLIDRRGVYELYYRTTGGSGPAGMGMSVSRDLIDWTPSSTFRGPGEAGSVFHGGFVLDTGNVTGYGTREKPALVAVLAAAPFLAFSTDEGKTWAADSNRVHLPPPLAGNPQDIAIFWYPAIKRWIMPLAVSDHVEFYSSADLRGWTFESSLGTDFFPEEVKWKRAVLYPSDSNHWVLLADIRKEGKVPTPGGTVYFAGTFDGHHFSNGSGQLHWLDYGEEIYGSVVAIGEDGRRINIGWWKDGGMTIPRELATEDRNGDLTILSAPVRELKKMYGKEFGSGRVGVSYKTGDAGLFSGVQAPMEVMLTFNTGGIQKGSFPIRFGAGWGDDNAPFSFVFDRFGYYYIDRTGSAGGSGAVGSEGAGGAAGRGSVKMPFDHADPTMDFHFIVHDGLIECFAEGGRLVMTGVCPPGNAFDRIRLFSVNGNVELLEGRAIELKKP